MDHITFMVTVFCIIGDWLKTQPRVRQRGPQPELADSEVLTIEVVGEFLGLATDKALYQHFCRYYGGWFPTLRRIDRLSFAAFAVQVVRDFPFQRLHRDPDEFAQWLCAARDPVG